MEDLKDFRNFLYLVWKERGWTPSDIQYKVADWIQEDYWNTTEVQRKILTAMRGFGKTELVALLAVFHLYHNPNHCVLIQSKARDKAAQTVQMIKQLILTTPMLSHMAPSPSLDQALQFNISSRTQVVKDPSVACYGIRSQITGSHGDLIIPDDTETPENSSTEDAREQLINKWLEYDDVLNPGGKIIGLGTPQTEASIYWSLAEMGYNLVRVPSEYPNPDSPEEMLLIIPFLRDEVMNNPMLSGTPTNPTRMDEEYLLDKKARSPSRYIMQMLLNPALANVDKYPLKLGDFIVHPVMGDVGPDKISWGSSNIIHDIPMVGMPGDRWYSPIFFSPTFEPFKRSVMYIDPAGQGGDEVGIAVGHELNGYIHCSLVTGLEGGFDPGTLAKIAMLVMSHNVKEVVVEANFGGGMFTQLLIPVIRERVPWPVDVRDDTVTRSQGFKEQRIIDSIEPPLAMHRIVLDPRVARDTVFCTQLTRIQPIRNCLQKDDRLDAFAGLIRQFTMVMSMNADEILENQRIKDIKAEYQKFVDSYRNPTGRSVCLGSIPQNIDDFNRITRPRKRRRWID